MNTPNVHPDTELLDRLRAGLLDDDPRHMELEAHLNQCAVCRQRCNWQGLMKTAELATPADEQQLDSAREKALRAAQRSPLLHRLIPLAVAASIALVVVMLMSPLQEPDEQLAATVKEEPELYEDLDFYLWLADHKRVDKDSAT